MDHNSSSAQLSSLTVTCTIPLVPQLFSCQYLTFSTVYITMQRHQVLVNQVCLLMTATHKHRSLGGGALLEYHGCRGTMEHSCSDKPILSRITAGKLFTMGTLSASSMIYSHLTIRHLMLFSLISASVMSVTDLSLQRRSPGALARGHILERRFVESTYSPQMQASPPATREY